MRYTLGAIGENTFGLSSNIGPLDESAANVLALIISVPEIFCCFAKILEDQPTFEVFFKIVIFEEEFGLWWSATDEHCFSVLLEEVAEFFECVDAGGIEGVHVSESEEDVLIEVFDVFLDDV